jgi:hypothetical protein
VLVDLGLMKQRHKAVLEVLEGKWAGNPALSVARQTRAQVA